MEGAATGIKYQNQAYDIKLSQRLLERCFPSAPLQPYFSPRPVPTKYNHLQVVDRRPTPSVSVDKTPNYSPESVFTPGPGPWIGYANNINVESVLKNQFFAIQGCPQAYFIPGSMSDLYRTNYGNAPHHSLPEYPAFNPNVLGGDKLYFNNTTRLDKDR